MHINHIISKLQSVVTILEWQCIFQKWNNLMQKYILILHSRRNPGIVLVLKHTYTEALHNHQSLPTSYFIIEHLTQYTLEFIMYDKKYLSVESSIFTHSYFVHEILSQYSSQNHRSLPTSYFVHEHLSLYSLEFIMYDKKHTLCRLSDRIRISRKVDTFQCTPVQVNRNTHYNEPMHAWT